MGRRSSRPEYPCLLKASAPATRAGRTRWVPKVRCSPCPVAMRGSQLVPATGRTISLWQAHFRSEEHTSELQSLMRISYAVFCLKKKKQERRTERTQDAYGTQ